jgi:iron complex outermembrane receptor protein
MKTLLSGGVLRARPVLWTALLATTMLTGVTAAQAADAPKSDSSTTVGEVIVTATKRDESIQKVPMSIQALDTRKLEQLDVVNFADYSKFLPSLSFQTLGPNQTAIYMRGVASGEDANHSGPLPSVGVYLDEQPITTIGGTLDVHIYDIARVEALAGPQGTLYGASSEAGTVRIITNKPDPSHFSAAYDAQLNTVAHGGIGDVFEGYVNIPINDKMAVRLVAFDEHDAGFIDNVPGTRTFATSGATVNNAAFVKKDFNTVDSYGGRAALKVDLNENWSITPSLMAQDQKANGVFGYDLSLPQSLAVQHFGPDNSHDRWYQAALTVQGKIGNYDLTYSGGHFWRKVDSVSDYMDYSYAYDQIGHYGAYWQDNSGNPLANPRQFIVGQDTFNKDSHEIRLASPATDRFRFVVGAFYQRQSHWIIQDYQIAGLANNLSVPNWPNTIWLTDQMRVDRDTAAFGEANFDITDKLTLTGGLRFYQYKNSLEGFYGFSEGEDNPPPLGLGYSHTGFGPGGVNCLSTTVYRNGPGCINLDKTTSGNGNTHRLTLTYKIDPDKLIYATWSTGFRPGGVNRNGNLPPYQADSLTNYEFGWKTSWLDHRLRWNGAIYQEDWKNFQFSFLGLNSLTDVVNANNARIRGVESDISWQAMDHLTLTAAGAYTDAELTSPYCGTSNPVTGAPITVCPGSEQAPTGQQLPVTPKFKGDFTARYTFDLADWNAHIQGDVVYKDATWADLRTNEREIEGRMPASTITDFSLGVERGNLTLELFVKNAFDSKSNQTRYTECTIGVCGLTDPTVPVVGHVYAVPITPRLIGIKIGQKF